MMRAIVFAAIAAIATTALPGCSNCPDSAATPAPCSKDADCGSAKCILTSDGGTTADGGTANPTGYCDVKETCA